MGDKIGGDTRQMTDRSPVSPLDNAPVEWPLLQLIKTLAGIRNLTVNAATFRPLNTKNETTNSPDRRDGPGGRGDGQVRSWSHGSAVRQFQDLPTGH